MRRPLVAGVAIAAAAVAVAGCGSSKKHTTAAATTTTETASSYSAYAPSYSSTKTTSSKSRSTTSTAPAKAAAPVAHPTPTASGKVVVVKAAKVGSLGTILVNESGRTLYTFAPDNRSKVTCTGGCAATWPPLVIPAGATVKAEGEVKQSLLGSDPDPEGGRVVTYNGWPLYTFVGDAGPGMASGQGLNLNGGFWYVIAPSGQVIH
jgi:predicted lipoprotein with Yx(FWY)xxD motif